MQSERPRVASRSSQSRISAGALATAFVALIAVIAIFAAITRSRDELAKEAASRPVSAEEALLKNARGNSGNPALNARFQRINETYFDDKLKLTPVIWEPQLESIGSKDNASLMLEGVTDGHVILLNPSLASDERRLVATLCHEMVHVMLFASGGAREDHGPLFQEKLRELLARGAFEGVIVSDAERAQMKTDLDREAAELDREFELIGQESRDLEAARPSVTAETIDSFNGRISAHNQRARELNDKVTEFNQMAARYNLAIQYPDGLDGARVNARAPIGPPK